MIFGEQRSLLQWRFREKEQGSLERPAAVPLRAGYRRINMHIFSRLLCYFGGSMDLG